MRLTVFVLDEQTQTWDEGRGKADVLICQDWSASGERLVNSFDYNMSAEEAAALKGRMSEKKCELVVTEFQTAFGGRLRARGRIAADSVAALSAGNGAQPVSVPAKPAGGK